MGQTEDEGGSVCLTRNISVTPIQVTTRNVKENVL